MSSYNLFGMNNAFASIGEGMRSISILATIVAGSLIVGASSLLADPPPQPKEATSPKKAKMTKEEMDKIRAKVLRCWMEIEVEDENGIVKDPNKLYGFRFGAEERSTWCRRGELSLGFDKRNRVIVRPDRDPMQVDFLSMNGQATKFFVTPCIFKFDGEKMILIEPTTGGAPYFREDGKYKIRPTSFTPTKKNKYRKMTLKPCFLYDQD